MDLEVDHEEGQENTRCILLAEICTQQGDNKTRRDIVVDRD